MASRGRLFQFEKEVRLYKSCIESDRTSHAIYYYSKHFPDYFMALFVILEFPLIQRGLV